jgi:hypothetical protein
MTFNARRRRFLGIATGASMLAGSSRFAKGATAASRQFRFDTVQMPLNVMDAHYDNLEKKVARADKE